MIKMTAIIL